MERFSMYLRLLRVIPTSLFSFLTIILTAQSNYDTPLPQYLYPEFSSAIVKMKNGNSLTAKMNYNMVTGNMVFVRDGKLYDLLNPETIDTVYLQNCKFVHFEKVFYEVIVAAPISLFLHHNGSLAPAGKPAGYGGTSHTSSITTLSGYQSGNAYYNLELPPDFIVKVDRVYWIRKDNNMSSFMNMKQFLKIFPDKESNLNEYIKKNHIKFERRNDLIKLTGYCNELIM